MRKAAILVVLALLVSCQLFTVSDVVQCDTDGDCQAKGGAFVGSKCKNHFCEGPLSCRGKVQWEPEDTARPLHTHVLFVDFAQKPVAGAKAFVCGLLDTNCDNPISGPWITGDDGYALIPVPRAFRGQIRVSEPPPGFDSSFIPTSVITFPPITEEETLATTVQGYAAVRLLTRIQIDLLLTIIHQKSDPGKAQIFGVVFDCRNEPLQGATIRVTPEDKSALIFLGDDNDVFSSRDKTAGSAIFAYLNVNPGLVELTVSYQNQPLSKIKVVANANVITQLAMPPSPL